MRFDLNLPKWKWPFYVARHPFEGFEDLRWKKQYSMLYATIIVALFFITQVMNSTLRSFLHMYYETRVYNIVPDFSASVLLFLTWVVANWALCTLFDGEGTMKRIYVTTAYSLVPLIVSRFLGIILSYVLLINERGFLEFVEGFGLVWTAVLLISGMKAVHQYSLPKTLISMAVTVLAMAVMVFLLVLFAMLFQQVYIFGFSIYTELMYRFPFFEPWQLLSLGALAIIIVVAIIVTLYKLHDYYLLRKEQKLLNRSKI